MILMYNLLLIWVRFMMFVSAVKNAASIQSKAAACR